MAQEKKLAEGQKFGQWSLIGTEPLGRGGNGAVWKAVSDAGTQGAIKFLHKNHFMPPTKRFARFCDEVKFMRSEAGNPGIMPLLDCHSPASPTPEDRPWLVTPLAVPFTQLNLTGATQLPDLVCRIEAIARTLAKLHAERKWHRDVKPDNLFDLNGASVLGDFGLADYPEKGAVTEATEIMGPLFYVAPELMTDAADTPAGPGDVYALAKTLWVLASGQKYPLQGQQRTETPGLRLSTYCPHPRAHNLDMLLERATTHDPSERETMEGFANELAAWLQPVNLSPTTLDLTALASEYQSVFQIGNNAERRRQEFIADAEGVLSFFDAPLERIAMEVAGVTNIPPETGPAYDLPPFVKYLESDGDPRVVWDGAVQTETRTGDDLHKVLLKSFIHVEALSDERIRLVAGHHLEYTILNSSVRSEVIGSKSIEAPWQSSELDNGIENLRASLIQTLPEAVKQFAEHVKAVVA